ncbi:MAG: NifB/NifX family molybdenum-iron cluster-binding protein [Deltaproteobacteria bacterium]|nr:NifB/NifX family molybdenum-iron cluster-binding protein [Deltaproteobacteria bacterium]
MKVAISSSGKTLDSQIDPRFGRCSYFILCDTNTMDFEVFDNESLTLSGSAGIQSGQFISSKGAEAVITGNCGPNAVRVLNAAKITMYTGQSGTVRDAIERLLKNELHASSEPNVPDHYGVMGEGASSQQGNSSPAYDQSANFGMGGGKGMGGGRGMGMGGGRCGGKGMGRGMGGGAGMAGANEFRAPSQSSNSKEEELRLLKKQAEDLLKQAGDIQSKISSLENS